MYDDLYKLMFDVVTFFNRSKQDEALLQKAGIKLDTALFPLLMRVAHYKALGIGQLAEQVNRNYSTVSRQIDKLVSLGLVTTVEKPSDKRVRKITLTDTGKAIAKQVAVTRRSEVRKALETWDEQEIQTLRSSLEHLAKTLGDYSNDH